MESYAQVHIAKQVVVNIVMWDGTNAELQPPAGYEMVRVGDAFCGPGFLVENGQFVMPATMEPGTNYTPPPPPPA